MCDVPQDFALGDFDNSAIAQMEEENEAAEAEAEAGPGKGKDAEAAGMDDEEAKGGEAASAVADLVRVPKTAADAGPRKKPRKPLIEEL